MNHRLFLTLSIAILVAFDSVSQSKMPNDNLTPTETINPIKIDIDAISGLNLKPVRNQNDPERRLFQKRILRGLDLSVYVVSSETATATHESYGIDEFLYLINGRARLNPEYGEEAIYNTGDFFFVPKGFKGEWETQGGDEFLIELSVISTERSPNPIDQNNTLPYLVDKAKLSGIGITLAEDAQNISYKDILHNGAELDVAIYAERPDTVYQVTSPMEEQFIYIISGAVHIMPDQGKRFTFNRGDFYLIPKGFVGTFEPKGHGLFRYLKVTKSK